MAIYEEISSNKRKSYLIFFVFFLVIALLGYFGGIIYGNITTGVIIATVFAFSFMFFGYFSGDKTILSISQAKPVKKEDYPHLVNSVEGLAIAAGIPTPKVYMIDDEAMNAFATGRNPQNASITVTKGLVESLNRTELEGVIGHEMSHVKNYDIRLMMLTVVLAGFIVLLSDFLLRSFFWSGGRNKESREGGNLRVILIIAGLILAILSPLIAKLIQLAISRKREFLADASGALITRYPQGLAAALRKIRDDTGKLEVANKATAHLYISNPLKGAKGKMASLFNTHPDINERIKKLEAM